MDAILTGRDDLTYFDKAPVIVTVSSDAAMRRAARTIELSGLGLADQVPVEAAVERIERQAAATAIWVEVDEDCGGPLDELLRAVSRDVAGGRFAAVVSTSENLLDPVVAALGYDGVELIVGADESERAAALAIATSRAGTPLRRRDRQECWLSTGPAPAPRAVEATVPGDLPAISAETVRSVIRARRLRSRYFSEELFAEPAWDMLLDLLQAEIAHLRVPVSSLCIAAAVPATTALRWLKAMVGQGLFVRRADPHDGRRVFVELAPEASSGLRRYFAEVGNVAAI